MESYCSYDSPLGRILLRADADHLTGLWFEGQTHAPARCAQARVSPVLSDTMHWLDLYFSGRDPGFSVPLLLGGTAFQRAVWQRLLAIPYGSTTTYGTIAADLAAERGIPRISAQAVGGAVGRNPVSILVPCHRVLGAGGSLTGYAGGIERKAQLLFLEGVSL